MIWNIYVGNVKILQYVSSDLKPPPLTHNVTKDCLLNHQFSTWKLQAQNIRTTCCIHKLFFVFVLTFRTIHVYNMFSWCSELVVFVHWTGRAMNNHSPYCGLVDARIRTSDNDLPVHNSKNRPGPTIICLSELGIY